MAKVHDKYVVELAEIIKGYGNDPDINDPFCLSTFYRFYEVPNVCVSAENLKKMRPLSDYTEEIEPESISEWKKEFREYVDSLDIARDDWKGIIEYIDELPSAEPDTTTHDSIPAKTGKNDGDETSGDCISRQAALEAIRTLQTYKLFSGDDMILIDKAQVQTELMMLPSIQPERKGTRLSTVCLLCKKPAVTFNTEDDIPYTNYSYCEDCLRKGLKLLREQKKNLQTQPECKKGHWIPVTNGRGGHQCDRCGCYAPSYQSGAEWLSNFCPECNADMKGEQDG